MGLFRLHHIVTRLHPEQPVYGLGSTPPRTVRDIETVEQRARNYLELVRRVRPHGPYCLVGFCAGGLVAFEMAQQLVAAGEVVALVGMINSGVPGYPEKIVDRLLIKVERLRHQLAVAGAGGKNLVAYLSQKREEYSRAAKQDRALAEAAREVSVTGFRPDDEMHNEVLLAETVKIFRNYQPRYFPGRISLFISDDEASAGVSRRLDSRYAWARYAREHEVRRFPGGHDDLIEMTHGALFSEVLHAALEDALAGVKAASGGPTSEVVGQGSGQQSREDENATPEGG